MSGLVGYLLEAIAHAVAAFPGGLDAWAVAALVLAAAYGAGRGSLGVRDWMTAAERVAFPTAAGLVLVASLAFALGLLGRFGAGTMAVGLALLQIPLLVTGLRAPRARLSVRATPGRLAVAVGFGGLAAFLGTLALYPPLGFDAATYHLPMAKALVESHRLSFLPDLRFPIFPQLGETLYATAMALGDDRAARLLQLGVTLLGALAVQGWCERRASRRAGLWAAALWLGSSYVVLFGVDAYVDTGVALFGFLALSAADRLADRPAGSADSADGGRTAIAAGAFAGAAAAIKYLGLYFVAVAPFAILLRGGRRRLPLAATALVASLVVAGPWYARITHETGNPMFPYFESVFGANEWSPHVGEPIPVVGRRGLGDRLRSVVVGDAGGWSSWVGTYPFDPWLLALAPVCLLLARRPRRALPAIAFGLPYAAALWLLAPEPRYLLPALPWACAACAVGLDRLVGRASPGSAAALRWAAPALALLLAAPGLAYGAYRIGRQGPVPSSPGERERFLANRLPGYAAISFLDGELGDDHTVYCLNGENVRYFSRGRFLGEVNGPARFSRVKAAAARGPDALAAELRSLGAEHFVVVRREGLERGPAAWDAFPRLFEDAWSRVYAVPPAGAPRDPRPPGR